MTTQELKALQDAVAEAQAEAAKAKAALAESEAKRKAAESRGAKPFDCTATVYKPREKGVETGQKVPMVEFVAGNSRAKQLSAKLVLSAFEKDGQKAQVHVDNVKRLIKTAYESIEAYGN